MPFVLIFIGLCLLITAMNGTYAELGTQLKNDIFGSGSGPSFIWWFAALAVLGFIGYIPAVRKPANIFGVLVVIGMILATKGGIFTKIQETLRTGPTAEAKADPLAPVPVAVTTGPVTGKSTSASNGGAGSASILASAVEPILTTAATAAVTSLLG